jgi:hypothetical protein
MKHLNKLVNKLIIAFILLSLVNSAQVLLPSPETAFEPQHNFNSSIIKTKGIKRITFEIIDKKDFEVAVDKNLTEMYEFNAEGLLSRYYYTTIVKTFEKHITSVSRKKKTTTQVVNDYLYDTVSTSYFYNNRNQLILKRYHDGQNYYESRYFRYDSLGNLTKEMRFKETNASPDKSVFILGNQLQLSEDSFQYQRFPSGQVKSVLLNNENRPYKQRIINFDSLGRKLSINESYTAAGWIMQDHVFEYKGGHLTRATFEGNANNHILLQNLYEYDEKNELYSEKQYKNEVLLKEISYVTDRVNGLLNSLVIRDPINKTMRIIKLKYDMGMVGRN